MNTLQLVFQGSTLHNKLVSHLLNTKTLSVKLISQGFKAAVVRTNSTYTPLFNYLLNSPAEHGGAYKVRALK